MGKELALKKEFIKETTKLTAETLSDTWHMMQERDKLKKEFEVYEQETLEKDKVEKEQNKKLFLEQARKLKLTEEEFKMK